MLAYPARIFTMPELHVNIDHVATVRQARRTFEPSPLEAVQILEQTDTAGITLHLREDRRHVQDSDIYEVDNYLRNSKLSLTFEMAAEEAIRDICLKTKSKLATLVPEKREELTTEGGMDLGSADRVVYLKEFVKPIQANNTQISLFIDPVKEHIDAAKDIGVEFIELHTGTYANLFIDNGFEDETQEEFERLKKAAEYAQSIGLNVNLGHGMTVDNLPPLLKIEGIKELHIGHSLIANSIYYGLEESAERFLDVISG